MKGVLGLIGLLLSLAMVGFLVKKQLGSTQQGVPSLRVPMAEGAQGAASSPATAGEQSQQIQQQVKQALEEAMQPPRAAPEEK